MARLGAALDPWAEKKAELRRLEKEMERWVRLDRRYNNGGGTFDWCSERETGRILFLKKRIQTLQEGLNATRRG